MALSLVVTVGIAALAAAFDLRSHEIPNGLSLGGLVLVFILLVFEKSHLDLLPHLMSLVMGTILGIGFFAMGAMGGGDGKMFMVVSLAFPFSHWLTLIMTIAIVGGLQAGGALLAHHNLKAQIPYGVSIFLGTLIYVLFFY